MAEDNKTEESVFLRKFDKRPNCGSPDKFCEYLTEKSKKKGLTSPAWRLFMDRRDGGVFDPSKAILLPIGGKVPAYHIATDICMECGTLYAVELAEGEATIRTQDIPKGSVPPPHNIPRWS